MCLVVDLENSKNDSDCGTHNFFSQRRATQRVIGQKWRMSHFFGSRSQWGATHVAELMTTRASNRQTGQEPTGPKQLWTVKTGFVFWPEILTQKFRTEFNQLRVPSPLPPEILWSPVCHVTKKCVFDFISGEFFATFQHQNCAITWFPAWGDTWRVNLQIGLGTTNPREVQMQVQLSLGYPPGLGFIWKAQSKSIEVIAYYSSFEHKGRHLILKSQQN